MWKKVCGLFLLITCFLMVSGSAVYAFSYYTYQQTFIFGKVVIGLSKDQLAEIRQSKRKEPGNRTLVDIAQREEKEVPETTMGSASSSLEMDEESSHD